MAQYCRAQSIPDYCRSKEYKQVLDLMNAAQYAEALSILDREIAARKLHGNGYAIASCLAVNCLRHTGRVEEAVARAKTAISVATHLLGPANEFVTALRAELGFSLVDRKDFAEALVELQAARSFREADGHKDCVCVSSLRESIALVLLHTGNDDAAIAELRGIPASDAAKYLLGRAHAGLQQHDLAIEAFRSIAGKSRSAKARIALCLARKGESQEALALAEEVLRAKNRHKVAAVLAFCAQARASGDPSTLRRLVAHCTNPYHIGAAEPHLAIAAVSGKPLDAIAAFEATTAALGPRHALTREAAALVADARLYRERVADLLADMDATIAALDGGQRAIAAPDRGASKKRPRGEEEEGGKKRRREKKRRLVFSEKGVEVGVAATSRKGCRRAPLPVSMLLPWATCVVDVAQDFANGGQPVEIDELNTRWQDREYTKEVYAVYSLLKSITGVGTQKAWPEHYEAYVGEDRFQGFWLSVDIRLRRNRLTFPPALESKETWAKAVANVQTAFSASMAKCYGAPDTHLLAQACTELLQAAKHKNQLVLRDEDSS
ncbi:unnamed protein product [Durusdinium trenchii]|uniref:Signal recognition particle subunit SRP72 n=1 Tax=Durusdinium trenchii TaxID=1381693 RepID=A0ABP0L8B0_9DINO